jgi:hypothetical protein
MVSELSSGRALDNGLSNQKQWVNKDIPLLVILKIFEVK